MLKTNQHEMIELIVRSKKAYSNPFVDVWVDCTFVDPNGQKHTIPAFFDGEGTWKVRFTPAIAGRWSYVVNTRPADDALDTMGTLVVMPHAGRGMLHTTKAAYGFAYENGDLMFPLGDTVYNLFGAAYCDMDVKSFIKRRIEQGFNILRVRCQVSPFHPPDGYSEWQERSTWPWGGSEQSPQLDRFNLNWFKMVDDIVAYAAEAGMGLEMIMQAWGFEYPFNDRSVFVPEYEKLWLRYLIARYDAYSSVYIWTLMNEYEYYPDGKMHEKWIADQWAMTTARWVKAVAPHGHVIAVHNGPKETPFAKRFESDPDAVDAILFQDWGSIDEKQAWLTEGIEDIIDHAFSGWQGSGIFAEYGYERNPDLPLTFPPFTWLGPDHNRRGAWRGAFCGFGVMNGWENTWGPIMDMQHDQPGVKYFSLLKRFFTQVVPFERLKPTRNLIVNADGYDRGNLPRVLSTGERDIVVVYVPAGGTFTLALSIELAYTAQWYSPVTGDVQDASFAVIEHGLEFTAPDGLSDEGFPLDWVLVVSSITL